MKRVLVVFMTAAALAVPAPLAEAAPHVADDLVLLGVLAWHGLRAEAEEMLRDAEARKRMHRQRRDLALVAADAPFSRADQAGK